MTTATRRATAEGLDPQATELAIDLQRVINRYHSLEPELKELPLDDPRIQLELELAIPAQSAVIGPLWNPIQAGSCS